MAYRETLLPAKPCMSRFLPYTLTHAHSQKGGHTHENAEECYQLRSLDKTHSTKPTEAERSSASSVSESLHESQRRARANTHTLLCAMCVCALHTSPPPNALCVAQSKRRRGTTGLECASGWKVHLLCERCGRRLEHD